MKIIHDKTIDIKINNEFFFDSTIYGIYQVSVASNLLYKLGNPINTENVIIEIDGYVNQSLRSKLEDFLSNTMNYRTMIRYNCITKAISVKIINNNSTFKGCNINIIQNNKCILSFSKGLDSRLAKFLLNKQFNVIESNFSETNFFKTNGSQIISSFNPKLINNTYIDTFDNDPWDDYGIYFVYLTLILNKALKEKIYNISIGLNKDDLLGYDIISNELVYSQCSQSKQFVNIFNSICKDYSINFILPLEKFNRLEICKQLINNQINIEDSISCVFYDLNECGMCFSCFDKLTGLLAAIAELGLVEKVKIKKELGSIYLFLNDYLLMNFKNYIKSFESCEKLPIDYIINILLNRILLKENKKIIYSSKFSAINIINILIYYQSSDVSNILFPRSKNIFINNRAELLDFQKGIINYNEKNS